MQALEFAVSDTIMHHTTTKYMCAICCEVIYELTFLSCNYLLLLFSHLFFPLSCLDTTTLQWTNIPPSNPYQSPMKKSSSGMVAFRDESKDYLFVFGGVGMLCSANQSEAIYIPWKENPDNGWTNEAHIFSPETSKCNNY